MTKQFLQETNFQEESEAFKNDALDNFEKHYPTDKRSKIKDKFSQWKQPEGDDSYWDK